MGKIIEYSTTDTQADIAAALSAEIRNGKTAEQLYAYYDSRLSAFVLDIEYTEAEKREFDFLNTATELLRIILAEKAMQLAGYTQTMSGRYPQWERQS